MGLIQADQLLKFLISVIIMAKCNSGQNTLPDYQLRAQLLSSWKTPSGVATSLGKCLQYRVRWSYWTQSLWFLSTAKGTIHKAKGQKRNSYYCRLIQRLYCGEGENYSQDIVHRYLTKKSGFCELTMTGKPVWPTKSQKGKNWHCFFLCVTPCTPNRLEWQDFLWMSIIPISYPWSTRGSHLLWYSWRSWVYEGQSAQHMVVRDASFRPLFNC